LAWEEYDYDFKNFTIYGPAETEEGAFKKATDRESNPGSSTTIQCRAQKDVGDTKLVKALRQYIKNGNRNGPASGGSIIRSGLQSHRMVCTNGHFNLSVTMRR
jgi:hypothetical protein